MKPQDHKSKPLIVADLGGEAREGFQTTQLGARLGRYGKARENALQFTQFLRQQGEHKLADALGDCGNYATFRDYFTIGQVRLSHFCTCKKHLICPLCAIRRGAKALRVYLARVQALMAANPRLRASLVTYTVKNGPDLLERFTHLTNSHRKYMKRRKGARQTGEIRKAFAGVFSIELKIGKNSGLHHPHVHAIWLHEDDLDNFKHSAEWFEITGDSHITDIRPIDMSDPVGGFCEVFKYAVKFSDLSDNTRLHAYKTLKGKRLQDSFGDLRGLDVEPSDADDLLEELPYIERFFYFVQGKGYVECDQTGEVHNMIAA